MNSKSLYGGEYICGVEQVVIAMEEPHMVVAIPSY